MDKQVNSLMTSISRRTVEYLHDEVDLEALKVEFHLKSVSQLTLKSLTTLVALGGGMEVYLAFSFEDSVIKKIFDVYTEDIEIDDTEIGTYLEETAGDMINLVTGNALVEVPRGDIPITITPPLYINEAKQIGRTDSTKIYMATITLSEGEMDIICIGPAYLFDDTLECKET